jgi:hypothetical protein
MIQSDLDGWRIVDFTNNAEGYVQQLTAIETRIMLMSKLKSRRYLEQRFADVKLEPLLDGWTFQR